MGVQLHTYEEGNGEGKLRCRIDVDLIQSQKNGEYFNPISIERVSEDTFFNVFRPFLEHILPIWRKKIPESGLMEKLGVSY